MRLLGVATKKSRQGRTQSFWVVELEQVLFVSQQYWPAPMSAQ